MSELLYHVKRTIIRYDEDPSGATRDIDILGTFTDLVAAKAAANAGLAVSQLPCTSLLFSFFPSVSSFPSPGCTNSLFIPSHLVPYEHQTEIMPDSPKATSKPTSTSTNRRVRPPLRNGSVATA
jgi:hypothetical protein